MYWHEGFILISAMIRIEILIIVLVSMCMLNFRCEQDVVQRPFDNAFEIEMNIIPLKKTYSLNDTIWLEAQVSGKQLFDVKTMQLVLADTGYFSFHISYYGFGLRSWLPNSLANVITFNGVNTDRIASQWSTEAKVENYGCSQLSYTLKIGFKPNHRGTYSILLPKDLLLGSCINKIIPYNATISFKFPNTDLNLDVFNAFAQSENLGSDQKKHFTEKLNRREMFVFNVQ
jgi:hypothetical protein